MEFEFSELYRSVEWVYEKVVRFISVATSWWGAMSSCTLVHLVCNGLWVFPVCLQFMHIAYGSCTASEFTEPYRSLQLVYKISFYFSLLATTWWSVVSGLGLVHLVYNSLQGLRVCVQFVYTAYSSCTASQFTKLYRSLQGVYKNAVHFSLLSLTWWRAVSIFGLIHLVYNAVRDLKFWYSLRTQRMVGVSHPNSGNPTVPYSGCTKMPFTSDFLPRPVEVPWVAAHLYT